MKVMSVCSLIFPVCRMQTGQGKENFLSVSIGVRGCSCKAFTLAELLIALAILGVIAGFTIPKVLQSQQDNRNNATAKEAAAAFVNAYQAYKLQNAVSGSTSSSALTPYLNYIRRDTVSVIDRSTTGTANCSDSWNICLVLANGGVLRAMSVGFGGTATTNALTFNFDPDGKASSIKGVEFRLYYDGALRTTGTGRPATYDAGGGPWDPVPSADPAWFGWD
jgi:prepilin-type N-terminal cleavage/methylation domain-containing protein